MVEQAALSATGAAACALRWAHQVLPLREGDPSGDAAGVFPWPASEPGASSEGQAQLLAIVDGLGHGPEAAAAAQAAMDTLAAQPNLPLADLLLHLNRRLAPTRGAAIGLAQVQGLQVQHAGIGNTRAVLLRGTRLTQLPSHNGIVGGHQALRISVNNALLQPGDWLLMFTDGILEQLQFPLQLPEWRRDPATLCQHLLQRWRAGPDDAGVLVLHVGAD